MKVAKKSVGSVGFVGVSVCLLLVQSLFVQPLAAQEVRIYTVPVYGPEDSDPAYPAWAAQTVSKIAAGNSVGTLGYRLDTQYFAENVTPNAANSIVRFAVHVVATDSSYLFTPNDLTAAEWSSDSLLDYSFSYTNPPGEFYSYTTQAVGIVWGNDGSSTWYTNSQSWSDPVNEFIFIGPEPRCYEYGTNGSFSYSYAQLNNYITGGSVMVKGTWSLNDGVNSVASASKTFYRSGSPSQLTFAISAAGGNSQVNYSGGGTNDTWTVRTASALGGPWSDAFTLNGAGKLSWPNSAPEAFLKAVLQ